MATLVLIRHAHAEPPRGDDRDRRLTATGRAECAAVRGWLLERGVQPERILTSTAARAVQTWALCAVGDVAAQPDERLYSADVATLTDLVAQTPSDVGTLLIVGHNPTLERYAWQLDGSPQAREVTDRGMAPAAAVLVELETWSAGNGVLLAWR